MKRLALIALCWLTASAGCAVAQERSVSYSTWIASGDMVTLRYLLPVTVAQRLMGVEVAVLTTDKLGTYLLQHETVGSAGGECAAIDQGFDLDASIRSPWARICTDLRSSIAARIRDSCCCAIPLCSTWRRVMSTLRVYN